MGMTREEILNKIATASVTSGGNNLRDGSGRAALRKFELTDGFKGTRAVFEFIVVSSRKKQVTELKTGKQIEVEPNLPGSDFSVVNMLDKHASAFGNVKAIVLALFNEPTASDADITETLQAMLDGNVGIGRVIDFDTYRRVTDVNKVEIVLPKWFGVDQTEEDIAKTKLWLESLAGTPPASATA